MPLDFGRGLLREKADAAAGIENGAIDVVERCEALLAGSRTRRWA
jgi:hypothetical protein